MTNPAESFTRLSKAFRIRARNYATAAKMARKHGEDREADRYSERSVAANELAEEFEHTARHAKESLHQS